MLRTVYLDAALQKHTGVKSIELDANTPEMLLCGLRSQLPNFRQALSDYPELSIVLGDKGRSRFESLTPDTYRFPLNSSAEDVYLISPTVGAGSEAIAYLIMEWDMSYAAAATVVSMATYVAVSVGVNIISSALAPSANTTNGGAADQRPSFLYNGAVNVIDQGYAVPLIYGTHMVGSIVVSAGVDITEMPYATTQDPTTTGQPGVPPMETWQFDGGTN